eukprot:Lankesteria_metandrocarpae@DN948_c0_g1_i1.p1
MQPRQHDATNGGNYISPQSVQSQRKSVSSTGDHEYSQMHHAAHHRVSRGEHGHSTREELSPRSSPHYSSTNEITVTTNMDNSHTHSTPGMDAQDKMAATTGAATGRVSLHIASPQKAAQPENASALRWIAMILLVVQTVASISVIRLSMTFASTGQPYIKSTVLLLSEVLKLGASIVLLCIEDGPSGAFSLLYREILMKPKQTLVVGVPAFLYMIQNELILHSLQNLSGAMHQVTYQLKTLTTALLSVMILNKVLSKTKWAALFLLTGSITMIQLQVDSPDSTTKAQGNQLLGLAAVLSACVTSGFAGVYLEKVLKESKLSIWLRNVQLAVLTLILLCFSLFFRNREDIQEGGFFQGYNWATVATIVLQSFGGMVVAAVLKYADNILKCFGNAVAIVLSCFVSWLMHEFSLSPVFLLETCCVMYATLQYATDKVYVPYLSTIHHQRRSCSAKVAA